MAGLPAPREGDDLPASRGGFAGFQMTGKTPATWQELRPQFIARVMQLIEQLVQQDPASNWLKEQAKDLGSLALDYAKAKLRREGVEVEKIEAEVAKLFAEEEKTIAEARKTHAEARAVEIKNAMTELQLALGMTRAMLIGDMSEEAVVFGQQIDAMIDAIKAVAGTKSTASGA